MPESKPIKPPSKQLPSQAVTVGAFAGGGLGSLAVWLLSLVEIAVPAEVAPPLGSFLGSIVGYFTRGGRKQ